MGRTPEDADGEGVAHIRHRTTGEVQRAVELNEKARALYQEVGQVATTARGGLTQTHTRMQKAVSAAEWCEQQHPKLLVHLAHAKELDAFEHEVAKSRNRTLQRLEGEARAAEQAKIDAEAEQRAALKRRAAEARQRWETHAAEIAQSRAPDADSGDEGGNGKKRRKSKKKARKIPAMEEIDAGAESEEAGALDALFDDSDVEDDVIAGGDAAGSAVIAGAESATQPADDALFDSDGGDGAAPAPAPAAEGGDSSASDEEGLFGDAEEGEAPVAADRKRARAADAKDADAAETDAGGAESKRARSAE